MATFNLNIGSISRSAGHSATHEAAYISGSEITDERNGTVIDYTRKRGILGTEIIGPAHMDAAWFANALESRETRKNSQVARKFDVALPEELDDADRWRLLHRLGTHLWEHHGVGVMIAQHAPPKDGWSSGRNHHGHGMFSTRTMDAAGNLGKKTRQWDVKETSAVIVADLRATWAQFVNEALAEAGSTATVDHRSLAERGIERPPRRHLERGEYIAAKMGRAESAWAKANREVEALIQKQQQLAEINHELAQESDAIRRRACRAVESADRSLNAGKRCLAVATHIRLGEQSRTDHSRGRETEARHHRRKINQDHAPDPANGPERSHGPAHGPLAGPGGRRSTDGLAARAGGVDGPGTMGSRMAGSTSTPLPKMSEADAQMLARAKREVDLPGWFSSLGWVADPEKSSANSYTMRGPDGSRVVIKRAGQDGHWTFFEATAAGRSGTIYDAAKHYGGAATTGQQFRACRLALASPPSPVRVTHTSRPTATGSTPRPTAPLRPLGDAATKYLIGERLLAETTIEAFRNALRERGGAAVAPHNKRGGEERGPGGWRSFSGGSTDDGPGRGRSAWIAVPALGAKPTQIIVAESFISGLSAWQMLPASERASTAVATTGGALCPGNVEKLTRVLARAPGIQMLDASDRGEQTTEQRTAQLRAVAESAKCPYRRLEPPVGGKDWNNAVRAAAVAQAAALMPATEDDEQALTL